MIWLAFKAFLGKIPFPLVHVDTKKKFQEMYSFRDTYEKKWKIKLIKGECPPIESIDPSLPPAARSAARKTEGLKKILEQFKFKGVIAGIRRDEQNTRAKERIFSPRDENGKWDTKNQPPEFWDHSNLNYPDSVHIRIHPLLGWTELDIWKYIKREKIPIVNLYFSKNGVIQNSSTGISINTSPNDGCYYFSSCGYDDASCVLQANFGNGVFGTTALTGTTYNGADGNGIFKYDPNSITLDSTSKSFKSLSTKGLNA